jgi:hypothetical protein
MRPLEPLKYLAGSLVLYYAVAACSGSMSTSNGGNPNGTSSGGAPGTSSGSGGAGSGSGASSGSGSPVPDANADTTQSGSRLKATYYVGSDGSKQFASWSDSARGNETCTFQVAADGATRCLPAGSYSYSYFSNSTCTTPAVMLTSCGAAPRYILAPDTTSSCTVSPVHIHSVSGPVSTLYIKSGSTCTTYAVPAGYVAFAGGAEIPASAFQDATLQTE